MHKTILKRLLMDETGGTAIEYGLLAAMLVVALITAFQGFGDESVAMLAGVSQKTQAAIPGGGGG